MKIERVKINDKPAWLAYDDYGCTYGFEIDLSSILQSENLTLIEMLDINYNLKKSIFYDDEEISFSDWIRHYDN